uniref:Uncharacterized protein n=1 Tax=Pseudo-nitzschia australis TaxID=44445 RepID=A0A7S4ELH7_9STRA
MSAVVSDSNRRQHRHRNQRRRVIFILVKLLVFGIVGILVLFQVLAYKKVLAHLSSSDSTSTSSSTRSHYQQLSTSTQTTSTSTSNCAILLFGLPRAFKDFVLPSLETNVIFPNARYGCDYFVHYYQQDSEGAGRSGRGGTIHHQDILLLEDSVLAIHRRIHGNATTDTATETETQQQSLLQQPQQLTPTVSFVSDTNETFWKARESYIMKYRNAKNADGKYTYFPYEELTYTYPSTIDNIVKQWHSVNAVWDAMEQQQHSNNNNNNNGKKRYDRVAMIRNDVIYITPIDIYSVPGGGNNNNNNNNNNNKDANKEKNKHNDNYKHVSVIPSFAKYPVNDRMIYGPYEAVEIWAAQRFTKIDEYARDPNAKPGMVMHSETFMNASLLQSIRKLEYNIDVDVDVDNSSSGITGTTTATTRGVVVEDPTTCFLRVRADGAIWIEDCDPSKSGFGGGYPGGEKAYTKLLRKFLPSDIYVKGNKKQQRKSNIKNARCRKRLVRDKLRRIFELKCS